MIASAITPEPIVATVRLESGDMPASIGAVGGPRGPVSRVIALYGRFHGDKERAVKGPEQTRAGR